MNTLTTARPTADINLVVGELQRSGGAWERRKPVSSGASLASRAKQERDGMSEPASLADIPNLTRTRPHVLTSPRPTALSGSTGGWLPARNAQDDANQGKPVIPHEGKTPRGTASLKTRTTAHPVRRPPWRNWQPDETPRVLSVSGFTKPWSVTYLQHTRLKVGRLQESSANVTGDAPIPFRLGSSATRLCLKGGLRG